MNRLKPKMFLRRSGALLTAALMLLSISGSVVAQSLQDEFYEAIQENVSKEQLETIADGTPWFDPTAGECAPIAGSNLATTDSQDGHARTIIGIAKTMGLGERGALIGLMTALVESGLKNYANDGEWLHPDGFMPYKRLGPISQALPHDEVGNDHDSVGIMQQRAVDGNWGPVDPDENLAENVKWLMTPSYAAFAFFRALKRLDDWRSLDPGVAAQTVQVSAYPERYAERRDDAQGYLGRLWDQSPAIPLPDVEAAEGLAVSGNDSTACPVLSGGARDRILQTIAEYAWPDYRPDGERALIAKPEYRTAIREAAERGEYIGDRCGENVQKSDRVGADCGGFTTRVMRDSGVDPEFNRYEGNTTAQFRYLREERAKGRYMLVPPSEPLEPGDIAIRATIPGCPQQYCRGGHTYFYVGDAMKDLVPGWEGDSASASQCDRTAMAGPNDIRENYGWYRFIGNVNGGETLEVDARDKTDSPNKHITGRDSVQNFPTNYGIVGRAYALNVIGGNYE